MKWVLKDPVFADMIRVKTGNIYHYGIYVSDDEVIQFGLAPVARPNLKPCDVEVCSSDIDTFLCGNFLEVGEPEKKELKKLHAPEDIVKTARARLGEKNYSIIYNNCEHFVYECAFGERFCSQTDNVRELFRSLPIVDVYVARISNGFKISSLYPPQFSKELNDCSDEDIKCQKYFSWKLLEYALDRTFGKKIRKLNFEKAQDGKWKCDACEFDVTFMKDLAAVVVSRKPASIVLGVSPSYDESFTWNRKITVDGNDFYISIKTENADKVRFYDSINIKI